MTFSTVRIRRARVARVLALCTAHMYREDGNSQGGILGTVLMAATKDISMGVLGVPGGPYAQLLLRSVDFDTYYAVIRARYPNPVDQVVLLNLIQMLWDRCDARYGRGRRVRKMDA